MSYLDFLFKVMLPTDQSGLLLDKFCNILKLCLGMPDWKIKMDKKKRISILAPDDSFEITGKQFDDIKRIILYQNVPHYDDTYIDPDLKKMMGEVDRLKSQGINVPTLERRMAIITAHCGREAAVGSPAVEPRWAVHAHQRNVKCCLPDSRGKEGIPYLSEHGSWERSNGGECLSGGL